MTNGISLIVFLLLLTTLSAQTVIDFHHVESDTSEVEFGPNLKHNFGFHLETNFPIGSAENDSVSIEYLESYAMNIGLLYKRKLTRIFALGLALQYRLTRFSISQESQKRVPTSMLFKQEFLTFHDVSNQGFLRINFDKNRGNTLGKYLDIGAYASVTFSARHLAIVDEDSGMSPDFNSSEQRIKSRGLDYVDRIVYGLTTRLGLEYFYVTANYRLSDRFKSSFNFGEMPFTQIGIGIVF